LAVAKCIGGNLISIPQVVDSDNLKYKDDAIGVIFPIYALAAPRIVRRFLEKVKFEADYIFAIGTYGNFPGAVMMNVQKLARKNAYRFDYADSLLMVDNCIPIFEIGEQIAKLPEKKTDDKMAHIIENIRNRKYNHASSSLAVRFFFLVISGILKYDKFAQNYILNNQCNNCGICTKLCPAKNITINGTIHFNSHCSGCQARLHLCPQNAIHLKNEKSSKRWRNP